MAIVTAVMIVIARVMTSLVREPLLLLRMEGDLITGPFLLAMILNTILLSQTDFVRLYCLLLISDSFVMGCVSVCRNDTAS